MNKNKLLGNTSSNLHIRFSGKDVGENALNGHPFDWQFSIGFLMVHIPSVDISAETKVGDLDVLVVSHQKNITTSQISVNDPVLFQILL